MGRIRILYRGKEAVGAYARNDAAAKNTSTVEVVLI